MTHLHNNKNHNFDLLPRESNFTSLFNATISIEKDNSCVPLFFFLFYDQLNFVRMVCHEKMSNKLHLHGLHLYHFFILIFINNFVFCCISSNKCVYIYVLKLTNWKQAHAMYFKILDIFIYDIYIF
ncbi:hypothetical protein ACJX0J_020050 [Zea mays]